MKKKILFLLAFLFGTTTFAQGTAADMRSLLKAMPEEVFPLLTHNNILDCIDFLDAKMKAEVDNRLGGKSEMTQLTDSTCTIKLSSLSVADVKIVKDKGRQSIIVTHTYTADKTVSSSQTTYTLDWKRKP